MSDCIYYAINQHGMPNKGSNQCGKVFDRIAPCEMEVFWKQRPDWEKCMLNPEAVESGSAIHEQSKEKTANAAARTKTLKKCANIVRKHYPKAPRI